MKLNSRAGSCNLETMISESCWLVLILRFFLFAAAAKKATSVMRHQGVENKIVCCMVLEALGHSHLEYCMQFWSPHLEECM